LVVLMQNSFKSVIEFMADKEKHKYATSTT
jgi:hypothetical protein